MSDILMGLFLSRIMLSDYFETLQKVFPPYA